MDTSSQNQLIESINWLEIKNYCFRGSKELVYPKPEIVMAHPMGVTRTQQLNVYEDKQWVRKILSIHYDRDYIVWWLRHNFVEEFSELGYRELQKLFGDAFEPYASEGRKRARKAKGGSDGNS